MESSYGVTSGTGTDWKRVVDELNRGRKLADQLRAVLGHETTRKDEFPAGSLVEKIVNSFTESISLLSVGGDDESDEISQVPIYSPGRKFEDAGESYKRPAVPKSRRGCYKRRRTSETWSKLESPSLIEDGHAWRKYGQKVILHAKHPRNYFRCTHKFDQGCLATKQVQKIQDDPTRFKTTYIGRHTCKNFQSPYDHIDTMEHDSSSIIWNFGADNGAVINPPVVKREEDGEKLEMGPQIKSSPILLSYNYPDHHENSYLVSTDHDDKATPFDTSSHHLLSAFSSEHHWDVISNSSSDVYSCSDATTHSFDMMDMISTGFNDLPEL